MDEKAKQLNAVNSLLASIAGFKSAIDTYIHDNPDAFEHIGIHAPGAIEALTEIMEREAERVRSK